MAGPRQNCWLWRSNEFMFQSLIWIVILLPTDHMTLDKVTNFQSQFPSGDKMKDMGYTNVKSLSNSESPCLEGLVYLGVLQDPISDLSLIPYLCSFFTVSLQLSSYEMYISQSSNRKHMTLWKITQEEFVKGLGKKGIRKVDRRHSAVQWMKEKFSDPKRENCVDGWLWEKLWLWNEGNRQSKLILLPSDILMELYIGQTQLENRKKKFCWCGSHRWITQSTEQGTECRK